MTSHVKIHAVTPRIQYVADGTLTEYEFPFAIFKTADIDIYFGDTLQDTSTYTVSGERNSDGGFITFESAPAAGTIITIVRNLSIERTSDFQDGGTLRADTLNYEFDYQIACQQQIADNLNRSMVLPPYATDSGLNLTLPTPSAGKAIVWNSAGTNLENSTVAVNDLESTLRGYKQTAESAASTATTEAGIASDKADIATTQAGIATTKAAEVFNSLSTKANKDMDNLSATGKTSTVAMCMPDYSAGVSLGEPSTYQTIPVDSFVSWSANAAGGVGSIGIYLANSDESIVMDFRVTTSYHCNMGVPVPAGWKVKSFDGRETITYFPMKGVSNA